MDIKTATEQLETARTALQDAAIAFTKDGTELDEWNGDAAAQLEAAALDFYRAQIKYNETMRAAELVYIASLAR